MSARKSTGCVLASTLWSAEAMLAYSLWAEFIGRQSARAGIRPEEIGEETGKIIGKTLVVSVSIRSVVHEFPVPEGHWRWNPARVN